MTSMRVAGLLDRLGLTPVLAAALWAIDPDQPAIPMSQLAQVLGCDRSNVTLISEKLESEGLAERRPHLTDRRAECLASQAADARCGAASLPKWRRQPDLIGSQHCSAAS